MIAVTLLTATSVQAQDLRTASIPRDPAVAFEPTTQSTSIPIGWIGFCRENPSECAVKVLASTGFGSVEPPIKLSQAAWRKLVAVNARVNRTIAPENDIDHWGVSERWSYPDDGKGDCEDYALLKRKLLIQEGFPRSALLMTVVRDEHGDGHAILTVVTDKGDLVLDNKRQAVLSWSRTGYRFLKRQSERDPNVWVAIGTPASQTETAAAQ